MNRIFTVGHSNTEYDEFLAKLTANSIETLVDVRSHPGSRRVLWANKASLAELQASYIWMPELGGPTDGDYSDPTNFPKHRIGRTRPEFAKMKKEDRPHVWWNQGLSDYERWMATDPVFSEGLSKLNSLAGSKRIAIMCAEALWWKCHRSMISDVWTARGGQVIHIMSPKNASEHPTGDALKERLDRYEYAKVLWTNPK